MKRKLVDITPKNLRALKRVQKFTEDGGHGKPSIPYLVNRAVAEEYSAFMDKPKEEVAA